MIGVYVITHVATGRQYVGKSVDVHRRLKEHFEPGHARRSSRHLYSAIAKYGRDAFTAIVLEDCIDDATALAREVLWIRELNTKTPNGFNLTDGGEGMAGLSPSPEQRAKQSAAMKGRKKSAETRARMSAAQKGNQNTKGHSRCPKYRAKIAASLMGHPVSEETRAKMSKAAKRRVASPETREKMRAAALRRQPISEESRAKMRAAAKRRGTRVASPETREKMRASQQQRRLSEKESRNA